jgi:hypothetical protein
VEAVLGTEIGEQVAVLEVARRGVLARLVQVGIEAAQYLVIFVEEAFAGGRAVERRLVNAAQEHPGIAADRHPEPGIERFEEISRRPMPAEPQVRREFFEALEAGGKDRCNFEGEFLTVHGLRRD